MSKMHVYTVVYSSAENEVSIDFWRPPLPLFLKIRRRVRKKVEAEIGTIMKIDEN